VASLTHRGSLVAAKRFFIEAQRWAQPLQDRDISEYVRNIATEILATDETDLSTELAERYLMYGILLQNYALHKQKFSADVL
jgi:hypothetical protein